MMKKIALACLALFSVSAQAAINNSTPTGVRSGSSITINYASNGTPLVSSARTVTTGANSGEMLIRDMLNLSGPAGNLPVTAQRVTTAAEVAGSIARGFVKGAGILGIGVMAYDLVTAVRGRMNGSAAEVDVGKAPVDKVVENWCVIGYSDAQGNPKYCATSAPAAWELYWSSTTHTVGCGYDSTGKEVQGSITPVLGSIHSSGEAYYYNERWVCNGPSRFFDSTYSAGIVQKKANVTQKTCPDGGSTGADGKCPTGIYTPVTAPQLQEMIKTAVTTAIAKEHSLSPAADITETGTRTLTGPATQTGAATTTTTTTATGSSTQTSTPTYNYTYGGDTITYNTTNTTVNNVTNNGVTTTTTTTETKPAEPTEGMCKLYPDSLACQKVGDPPRDEIPKTTQTVTVSPEAVNLPEGCPADIPLPGGKVLSYATACDAAQKIRPVVIAAGVLAGLLIAVAALRGVS